MNKLIKMGLFILLASMVAIIFVVEYRSVELYLFFNGSSPPIIMALGGLILVGVITTLVGIVLKIRMYVGK